MGEFFDNIKDKKKYVRILFETAVQKKIEDCKKNPQNVWCFTTPCPPAWGHFEDWRTPQDKFFENLCRSYLHMAYNSAQSFKTEIDYYDIICMTLFKIVSDADLKKVLINEILRYTNSDEIRAQFAEELLKLNKQTKLGISQDAFELIEGIEKLKINYDGSLYKFDYTTIYIDNIVRSGNNDDKWNTCIDAQIRFVEEHPHHTGFPTRETTLIFKKISCFNFHFLGQFCRFLDIKKDGSNLKFKAYTIDYPILSIECSKIIVQDIKILQDKSPYEGLIYQNIELINNNEEDAKIFLRERDDFDIFKGENGDDIIIPSEKEKPIIIPSGKSILLGKAYKHDWLDQDDLFNLNSNSNSIIKDIYVGTERITPTNFFNDSNWDAYEHPDGIYYDNCIDNLFFLLKR